MNRIALPPIGRHALLSIALAAPLAAQTSTWNTNGGSWNNGTNWSAGVPDSNTAVANFVRDFTAASTITLDLADGFTVNRLNYDDTGSSGDVSMTINEGTPTGGTLDFAGTTPTVDVRTATLTINPGVSFGSGFSRIGGGTLTLNGPISFGGTATFSNGTTNLNGTVSGWSASLVNSVTGGTVVLGASSGQAFTWAGVSKTAGGGTLQYNSVDAPDLTLPASYSVGAGTLALAPSGSFTGTSGFTKSGNGTLAFGSGVNASGTYQVTGGLTFNGSLSGSGTLTKAGAGTMLIANASNSHSGNLEISAGTVQLGNGGAGYTVATSFSGIDVGSNTLLMGGSSNGTVTHTYNFSGNVGSTSATDPATAIQVDGGILAFSSTNATTKAFNGRVNFSGNSSVNYSSSAFTHNLNLNRAITGSGTLTFNWSGGASARSVNLAAIGTTGTAHHFTGDVVLNSSSGAVSFNLNQSLGAGSYEIRNSWTLVNGVTNGIASASLVRLTGTSSGLSLTQSVTSTTTDLAVDNGTVSVGNAASTLGNLTGGSSAVIRGTGVSSALTVHQSEDGTYAGALEQTAGNSLEFRKEGNAVLTLSGTSSYTGATLVSAGTLLISGSLGDTAVTVEGGATIGGGGSIAGSLGFEDGGQLRFAPGITLSVAGGVTFENFGIDDLVGLDSSSATGVYTLIEGSVDFTNVQNVGELNAASIGGGKTAYFREGSLELVVVPEPSAWLTGLLAMGLLGFRRRR